MDEKSGLVTGRDVSQPHCTSKAEAETDLEDKSSQKENLRGRLGNAIVSPLLSYSWHVRPPDFNGNHTQDMVEEKQQHTCSVYMSELC